MERPNHPSRFVCTSLIFILLLGVVLPSHAQASTNLRQELSIVAKNIARFLKGRDEDSIAIGQFTGPPQLVATGGPGIIHILTQELKKQNIEVKRRAKLGIKGEYRDVIDAKSDQLAAEIKGQIVDRSGEVLLSFSRGIFGDSTLSSLFGTTVQLSPNASTKTRDKQLVDSLDHPKVTITNHRIRTAAGSPYAIEILVKSGDSYIPVTPKNKDDLAFVSIKRDQVYAIRLINDSDHDAGVTLTIDGLNTFSFSENKEYTQFVIPAGKTGLIEGWHRNNQVSDAFLVTEYAKSAAAELNQSGGNLGTITASFSAAWAANQKAPTDEPRKPNQFARSANATGRGPKVEAEYNEVARQFGVIRGAVSVRYSK